MVKSIKQQLFFLAPIVACIISYLFRIQINNHNCIQKAKCQICKFEWIEFWYMPEQSRSFYQQLSSSSKRYKKISREDKRVMPLQ
ncbi:MAG: hypothetical protein WAL66_08315 [Nitrososphaeraceae archaeon]